MGSRTLRLGMVAGEASGDLLAGLLLMGMKAHWPELHGFGVGGPRMQAQGFESGFDMQRMSVFGYVDAIKRLPGLLHMRRQLAQAMLRERPDVFIGVDAPDFNFTLEARLRAAGLRTVHFVCPSIWAWRAHRVHHLARAADHVLCLFPFEPPLLAQHGIAASYVGHPLADQIALEPPRHAARQALGLAVHETVVALLPGSRRSEVGLLAPLMMQAALLMGQRRAGLRFVLPAAPGLMSAIGALMRPLMEEGRLLMTEGRSHEVLAACDVCIVASGTATLEAALFKRPMVITYKVSALNWLRMRRLALQPWFGLPNILARDFIVPELMQEQARPNALADAALAWLDDEARVGALQSRLNRMHLELRQDTAHQAVRALETVLHG